MGDGRTDRWVEHRAEVRRQLVESAIRAIEQIGPQVSMREIAAEAKVPKPTLYRFFTDKSELAKAIGDQARDDALQQLMAAQQPSIQTVGDVIHVAVLGHATAINGYPNVFRFLMFGLDNGGSNALENSRVVAGTIASLLETIIEGFGGGKADVSFYASTIVGVVAGAANWWINGQEPRESVDAFVGRLEPAVRSIVELAATTVGITVDFDAPVARLLLHGPSTAPQPS
ncbi:TetR/AcrR family transcriptional regulator [Nocardia vaccinii]|uniref:TetR/AcrR family transcriptional regulator n=1 Tax=Nocardia vaccinii TaxID=1822 RepID=UPI00082A953B|nr:TetR/AcrR family transcriptional regulator [Nocardia vaccinii]